MKRYRLDGGGTLVLWKGDITTLEVAAIVNAAKESLLGGGGVDGAIHRAAGPQLLEACRQIPEVSPGVRCPTGQARITPGFELAASWIIHTVGPVYRGDEASRPLLESAYRSCLELANDKGLSSLAFPAISCGVFGYPLADAAEVALSTCRRHAGGVTEIRFALFSDDAWRAFVAVADAMLEEGP